MPLHRKKHYDQRRWLMKQPFEAQEKAQRRLDFFFYAIIAAAVVVAMSFSLFKNHNIGRAVLFSFSCFSFGGLTSLSNQICTESPR